MLAHTKKPLTKAKRPTAKRSGDTKISSDNIEILVTVPKVNASKIKQYLKKQGCVYVNEKPAAEARQYTASKMHSSPLEQDLIDAKELFAERTPANMLIGARGKENITQVQLSQITGIPRRHISDMENGRRPIGKQNAMKLEKALNISYRLFL